MQDGTHYRADLSNFLVVGYSAGGGYDVYARALARHMGRFIPGNPTIVPKNMPGAGSLVLANWLYNVAAKDGTAFGMIGRGTAFDPLLGSTKAQFDAAPFALCPMCFALLPIPSMSWESACGLPFAGPRTCSYVYLLLLARRRARPGARPWS